MIEPKDDLFKSWNFKVLLCGLYIGNIQNKTRILMLCSHHSAPPPFSSLRLLQTYRSQYWL